MHGIPVVIFNAMIRSFERAGIRTQPHLEAAGITELELGGIRKRVDWNEAATALNACVECGQMTPEEQEEIGESFAAENPYLQIMARLVCSPMRLHLQVWKVLARLYEHLTIEHSQLDFRTLSARITVPEPYVACELFLRGTAGACRVASTLLGLPASEVRAEVDGRTGRYWIRLPEADGSRELTGLEAHLAGEYEALVTQALAIPSAELSSRSVLDLQRRFGLTRAEARVAARVADGLRLNEIAADLRIGLETVRTHLKRVYDKTKTRRQVELVLLVRAQDETPA